MRLKIEHILFMSLTLVFTPSAQSQYAQAAQTNLVHSITQDVGAPVLIKYNNGTVAQMLRKEKVDEFRTPISLSENSCKTMKNLSCQLVVPYVRQQFAAVWKNHPTRQGLPLEYSFDQKMTYGRQLFITRAQNELYETALKRIEAADPKARQALNYKPLARIECDGDISTALPASSEILFWDETYEAGLSELVMTDEGYVRVTLNNNRSENLGIQQSGKVLHINRYRVAYGDYNLQYPLGMSYSSQLIFRAPNIDEPKNELCEVKWLVNFSIYFQQVSALLRNADNQPFNPAGYTSYIYSLENSNYFSREIFKNEVWQSVGLQ